MKKLGTSQLGPFFNGVETSFNLDDETFDRLIEVGGRLLRNSPDYQKFLAILK